MKKKETDSLKKLRKEFNFFREVSDLRYTSDRKTCEGLDSKVQELSEGFKRIRENALFLWTAHNNLSTKAARKLEIITLERRVKIIRTILWTLWIGYVVLGVAVIFILEKIL